MVTLRSHRELRDRESEARTWQELCSCRIENRGFDQHDVALCQSTRVFDGRGL